MRPRNMVADQTIYNRDGSTEVKSWDTPHGDALQVDTLQYTNGTVTQTIYDTADANSWDWSRIHKSGGLMTDQLFHMPDGTQQLNLFDTAHGDALMSHSVVQADGSQVQTVWDTSGSMAWGSYVASDTATGQMTQQVFHNRDGSTLTVTYLASGPVLSDTLITNAAGVAIQHTQVMINGDVKQLVLDGSGNASYEVIHHPDGSTDIIQQASEHGHVFQLDSTMDANGRDIQQTATFHDGSFAKITYDSVNSAPSGSFLGTEAQQFCESGGAFTTVADNTQTQTTTTTTDRFNLGGPNGLTIDHNQTTTTTTGAQSQNAEQHGFFHDALEAVGKALGLTAGAAVGGAACAALGVETGPGAVAAAALCGGVGGALGQTGGGYLGGKLGDFLDHGLTGLRGTTPVSFGDPTSGSMFA